MAVKIKLLSNDTDGPVFEATDLASGEPVVVKNFFEKSKDKWHIVLAANSANRKYVSHNEFFTKAVNDEYTVEDKTTGPRSLGTAQPDKKLVPYMTAEDKEEYDAIIARAIENKKNSVSEKTEEEKLLEKIAKLEAKLAALDAE
jgi:hypothetical protein